MSAAHPAIEFITALFGPHKNGRVRIESLSNIRDPDDKIDGCKNTRSSKTITDFIARHDRPGFGCFVCVNPIKDKATRRAEKNVVEIVCAHADIDFSLVKETPEEIGRAIAGLLWPPSRINHSGHGLHLYWFLLTALAVSAENIERHKKLLKRIADLLAGDPAVCEIARLMRLPGTTNSKNGEQHLVRTLSNHDDLHYEYTDLERQIIATPAPLLHRKDPDPKGGNGGSPDNPFLALAGTNEVPIDVDQRLADMVYLGDGGGGNVHDTELRCSAAMLSRGEKREVVIERCLAAFAAAAARSKLPVDLAQERRKLEKLCDKWIKKLKEREEQERKEREEQERKEREEQEKRAREAAAKPKGAPAKPAIIPIDLWNTFELPPLPHGLLPSVIEDFAFEQGESMGADPAGLAAGALAVCSTAISDSIQLRVKRYGGWTESTRLWVALVGDSSTKKTPILRQVMRPLKRIDSALWHAYRTAKAEWDALSREEKRVTPRPPHVRIMINDVTVEATQEILCDSPDGVMYFRDELSGFFGAIDKYAGVRGGAHDRGFWLQAYNGDSYTFDRVGRGSGHIERLAITVLGGIQPEPMRKLAAETIDDGLIQRLNTIMLRPGSVDRDEELSGAVENYEALVTQLHDMRAPTLNDVAFEDAAREIREELARKHHEEISAIGTINKRLSAHIGKYDGMFARLCLLFHCIEHPGATAPPQIDAVCARRVVNFMAQFLERHAFAFYANIYGLSDDHDQLTAIAGYILAHKKNELTNRIIQRGNRSMRKLDRREIESICQRLDALGWITEAPRKRITDPLHWSVNPEVHRRFQERAKQEAERRQHYREIFVAKTGQSEEDDDD